MFVMSLDFEDAKNTENMSMGMAYMRHQALHLLYFDLFLMKQYDIKINPYLILGVDGCFIYFCIK